MAHILIPSKCPLTTFEPIILWIVIFSESIPEQVTVVLVAKVLYARYYLFLDFPSFNLSLLLILSIFRILVQLSPLPWCGQMSIARVPVIASASEDISRRALDTYDMTY